MSVIFNNMDPNCTSKHPSKGNQLKFCIDNIWYKADFLGYEGASEYLASEILKQSNCNDLFSFVEYQMTDIVYNDQKFIGCKSKDFLKHRQDSPEIICLDTALTAFTGSPVSVLFKDKSLTQQITFTVDTIVENTGLTDFGKYLTFLFEFDRLILNEDRHMSNIAILKTTDGYDYCPIFDHGAAFLSDTQIDYPINKSVFGLMTKVKAKPFHVDFDKQVDACTMLYGKTLQVYNTDLSAQFIEIENKYNHTIRERMSDILDYQLYNTNTFLDDKCLL